MTFEDMMKMKRLGETAVSPDGKWLAYCRHDRRSRPKHENNGVVGAGDCGQRSSRRSWPWPSRATAASQFAPDGKRILFLSGREGGQQVWLADFDPATGATSNPKKLTAISTEAGRREVVAGRPLRGFYFWSISRLSGDHDGGFRHRRTSATRIATRRWPRAR